MNKQVKCMDCGTTQYQDDGKHEYGNGYDQQHCVFCGWVIIDYLFGYYYCEVINRFPNDVVIHE